jgi:hypothetical protein
MVKLLIRTTVAAVMSFSFIVVAARAAADRDWQKGTWTQVGINRTLYVADVVHERLPPDRNYPQKTEVARYVIETEDRRYELQAMVSIHSDEYASRVTVGTPVTFAVEKKTAYIKLDEHEYRLLVLKNERKKTP